MKDANFYIVLNLRTATGNESFGKFSLGQKRVVANNIFRQLKGSSKVDEKSPLTLDLQEMVNGLPVNIQMISCTLEELTENCKLITREVFKHFNLEES